MKLLFVRSAFDKEAGTRSVVLKTPDGKAAEVPALVYCKGLVPMQEYDCTFVGGRVVDMKPCFKVDSKADVLALFKEVI